jgi:hypothetical protein
VCAWCKLQEALALRSPKQALQHAKPKEKAAQPLKSAVKAAWTSGKKWGTPSAVSAESAAPVPCPETIPGTVGAVDLEAPSDGSPELCGARDELLMVEAMHASLKGNTSAVASARREMLAVQVRDLQHRVNSFKAPKERLPGLRKAVKAREGALQLAMDRQGQMAERLREAQCAAAASVASVSAARKELDDIRVLLLQAESEAGKATPIPVASPMSRTAEVSALSSLIQMSATERFVFEDVMSRISAAAAVSTGGAVRGMAGSPASSGLPSSCAYAATSGKEGAGHAEVFSSDEEMMEDADQSAVAGTAGSQVSSDPYLASQEPGNPCAQPAMTAVGPAVCTVRPFGRRRSVARSLSVPGRDRSRSPAADRLLE